MKRKRARVVVNGAVQGVGFRPFVYRLAGELGLAGWVSNSAQGVLIEAEGPDRALSEFLARLEPEKPPLAIINGVKSDLIRPLHDDTFRIRESDNTESRTALILPDIATCPDCLREILDPGNRRYLYPFANCTHCGPRFSIIERLPYDRANTSMRAFTMCADCEREYHDPRDRRFHAQPNACPRCGPSLEFWDDAGRRMSAGTAVLNNAAQAVRGGSIVALKGIGGFQLIADARNQKAVERLRARKHRPEKPFAVMFPSLAQARATCEVSGYEQALLWSIAAPIVLLKKLAVPEITLAAAVAPGNPWLGVMLPYSPLHHLLLRALSFPIVATSGNIRDEPICIDEHEALERLRGIADFFLVHNRPIVRHVDDSVAREMLGREMILRRARGYAPLPIRLGRAMPPSQRPILALGAHLKNTVALAAGGQVFISQHVGDLETDQALRALHKCADDLPGLYQTIPELIACDLHPDYASTQYAQELLEKSAREAGAKARCVAVQHHYAHVLSCMAENGVSAPALGVSWDGTGLGTDGTIWGGEFLLINETSFERVAHFRTFRLPGGDAAIKEPRRSALGLLYETLGEEVFDHNELPPIRDFAREESRNLLRMLARGTNSPLTSSAGRLFDAMAAIVGLRQRASFEGQAAMDLEFAIADRVEDAYPFALRTGMPQIIDWEPMLITVLNELRQNEPAGVIAAKFHNTLGEIIVAVARGARVTSVVLSGGCFQNEYLLRRCVERLREDGFAPNWHSQVPTNDGGISLGQAVAALRTRISSARRSPSLSSSARPDTGTGFKTMKSCSPQPKRSHVSRNSRQGA